ncbi:hypothetical protein [Phormidium sp. CCY1219]|nr:hypothetical protein [Phormidium sp. CCY1219]MEB3828008.1 hypothetical protein [Phormidium sp. CCY1219]
MKTKNRKLAFFVLIMLGMAVACPLCPGVNVVDSHPNASLPGGFSGQ